jgi:hypothetical protein
VVVTFTNKVMPERDAGTPSYEHASIVKRRGTELCKTGLTAAARRSGLVRALEPFGVGGAIGAWLLRCRAGPVLGAVNDLTVLDCPE